MWLKIMSSEASSARLSWGNSAGPYPATYSVGLASVRRAADEVRQHLQDLSEWACTADAQTLPPVLKSLAEAGFQLRYALFDSPSEAQTASEVEAWVREQEAAGDRTLCITADPAVHIPWGLLFDQDPFDIGAAEATQPAFSAFWCLKYSLSATLSGYGHSKAKLARPGGRCRLLSLVNRHVAEAVSTASHDIGNDFHTLLHRPIGAAYDLEGCSSLIDSAGVGDTVFHFFGHQHEGELDLGDDKSINVFRFKLLMDRITKTSGGPSQSCGLVFINACNGAFGDADYSFVAAADRPGLCGLISTESVVPSDFAARFSLRFLGALFNCGASVGEVMDELRHDESLWPLNLLYGCYAQPDFRIKAEAQIQTHE